MVDDDDTHDDEGGIKAIRGPRPSIRREIAEETVDPIEPVKPPRPQGPAPSHDG
ncbi:MAG TPA: hypothetical protein VNS19_03640 [Acidimicrobiales bacterium]|nr:hypothetical protein [Acidimicrobiales bacterium]